MPIRGHTLLAILATAIASVAHGTEYELSWFTIDGGGGYAGGGAFEIVGTVGQTDTGRMSGGVFVLEGGYWPGAAANPSIAGDCNSDGTIGLADYACLVECFTGPNQPIDPDCAAFDLNGDARVDLKDYTIVAGLFGGA